MNYDLISWLTTKYMQEFNITESEAMEKAKTDCEKYW